MVLALEIVTGPVIFAMVAEQKLRSGDKAPPTPPLTKPRSRACY